MKILHLSSAKSWRGGEQQIAYLVEALQEKDIPQIIYCPSHSALEKYCFKVGENYNGEMDFNVLGIPSEPFGFSGKPKSRWRMPTFHELKFEFKSPNLSLPIKLMNWSPF